MYNSKIAEKAIKIEQVSKTYRLGLRRRPVIAVKDLSLEIASGETFAFLGLNGAGKTTTIKMLLDHARPTFGRVWLFGREATLAASRDRVGYMPDLPHFYRFLTTRELLNYFARLFGISRQETERRIANLLQLVGLENRDNEPLKGFSRGMLQRVGLAQALINDPDLLILDEPLGGLDPVGRHQFHSIILELKKRGKTIFFSSHILEDAEKIADRVGIIHHGSLIASGSLNDLLKSNAGWDAEVEPLNNFDVMGFAASNNWTTASNDSGVILTIKDDESLNRLNYLISAGNIRLHALIPRHLTLEETFLKEVKRWDK